MFKIKKSSRANARATPLVEINYIVPQNSIPYVLVRSHEIITECKKKVHLIIDQWLSK
jgi:hypothetical protein